MQPSLRPLLLVMALGCQAEQHVLQIELLTDLRPGSEAAEVTVEVFRGKSVEGSPVEAVRTRLDARIDPRRGIVIASFDDLTPGDYVVRTALADTHDRQTGLRTSLVALRGMQVLRVVITRDCLAVSCPGAGDPADATECRAGMCVAPECMPDDPGCNPDLCTSDSDCPSTSPCDRPACMDGACLIFGCPPLQRCEDTGCVMVEPDPTDGGTPSRDVGIDDDDAGIDAGIDTGPPPQCDEDRDCDPPEYGSWSACTGRAEPCGEVGTRTRSVRTEYCRSGRCDGDNSTQSEACTEPRVGVGCDDGNPCTTGDVCAAGSCAGAPMGCDDGNQCTDDGCADGACFHVDRTGPCDDGIACTMDDSCSSGSCYARWGDHSMCPDLDSWFCTEPRCDIIAGCYEGPRDCGGCNCYEGGTGCACW